MLQCQAVPNNRAYSLHALQQNVHLRCPAVEQTVQIVLPEAHDVHVKSWTLDDTTAAANA